jgi:hypothetical protein
VAEQLTVDQQLGMIIEDFREAGVNLSPERVSRAWSLVSGSDAEPYPRFYRTIIALCESLKRRSIGAIDVRTGSDSVSGSQIIKNIDSIMADAQRNLASIVEFESTGNFSSIAPKMRDQL